MHGPSRVGSVARRWTSRHRSARDDRYLFDTPVTAPARRSHRSRRRCPGHRRPRGHQDSRFPNGRLSHRGMVDGQTFGKPAQPGEDHFLRSGHPLKGCPHAYTTHQRAGRADGQHVGSLVGHRESLTDSVNSEIMKPLKAQAYRSSHTFISTRPIPGFSNGPGVGCWVFRGFPKKSLSMRSGEPSGLV